MIENEETEHVLVSLPVAALRLEGRTVDALKKLGLKYIGDVIDAPRAPLTRRFGPELLLRLDQALGREEEPVSPRRPVASLSAESRLIEPIGTEEQILAVTRQVALSLQPSLEARGLADGCSNWSYSASTAGSFVSPSALRSRFANQSSSPGFFRAIAGGL